MWYPYLAGKAGMLVKKIYRFGGPFANPWTIIQRQEEFGESEG
jgi:hypothetical protein